MKWFCVFLLCTLVYAEDQLDPLSDEYIDYLNQQDLTWTAGRNFDTSMTMSHIQRLLGVKSDEKLKSDALATRSYSLKDNSAIPESFDASSYWPQCTSIRSIRDQSNCGSCWALASVEVMSDRICITSDQSLETWVSATDLLTCCAKCGDGCDGGYPTAAFEYWYTDGIVSGGLYNDTEGCQPYPFEPCEHHHDGTGYYKNCSDVPTYTTPQCNKTCINGSDYNSAKTRGREPYAISSVEEDIQMDIMTNGPVVASFDVFPDFLHYKSGIYKKATNQTSVGQHAVKIIGWGVEKVNNSTVPYWIIVNSWNTDWGEAGTFRMIRGENDCGIESNIVAGLPSSSTSFLLLSSVQFGVLFIIAIVLKYF